MDSNMIVESFKGVKVSYPKDCGNAPKKLVLINFYIAFANNDDKYIDENTSNNLSWNIIGDEVINDKSRLFPVLNKYREKGIKEIQILNAITHGNVCAANGNISYADKTSLAFCDVFKFSGFGKKAKVKEITSYIIRIE